MCLSSTSFCFDVNKPRSSPNADVPPLPLPLPLPSLHNNDTYLPNSSSKSSCSTLKLAIQFSRIVVNGTSDAFLESS